jgi:hypothetical protein
MWIIKESRGKSQSGGIWRGGVFIRKSVVGVTGLGAILVLGSGA